MDMAIKIGMLVVFFGVMLGTGFYCRKHSTDVDGFVLGGRSVGPWLTAFAFGTSYFSAVVFVGYAGQFGWKYGIAATWAGIGNALIGSLMAWGILSIALGAVKPNARHIWKSAVLLVGITLWAKLGNVLMLHNWFFLEEHAFYIGLVANGIIPKWVLMIANPVVFLLAVLALYGVCHMVQAKGKKKETASV